LKTCIEEQLTDRPTDWLTWEN